MGRDYEVIGYTADFPYINLELKKKDIKSYEGALLVCHIEEIKKGMKVSKIYKTTKKGTSIKYIAIKSEEDGLKYKNKVEKMIDDFNKKYSI